MSMRQVGLVFFMPVLISSFWSSAAFSAGTASADGATSVPSMTVPLSGYLTPRAKEVILTHDGWGLAGYVSPKGPDSPVTVAELRAYCAARSRQIIESRLDKQYPASVDHETLGGIPVDVVTPKSGIAARNRNRILINLHGGGFIGKCPDGLVDSMPIASIGRIKVITVDYREAPEAKFPAASEDVTAVYRELLRHFAPENIGIYGCSVGGELAGQATAWIITHHMARPGAIGVLCAGLVGYGGDSMYTQQFLASPPTAGIAPLFTYTKDADTSDPTLYPGDHPDLLAKFPPVLLVTATRDLAMSAAIYSHNQLAKAGVESQLYVWDGLWHSFILDDLPEAKDATDIIVRFFDRHLGTAPASGYAPTH